MKIDERKGDRDRADLELSIIMPCLNEAETVGICIEKAQRCLVALGVSGEVLIADNGSTDGSDQIACQRGARVVHVETRGYGSALMGGIAAARGKFIIMGDADDSYDFTALAPFIEKLHEGYDLVLGNRFKGGIRLKAMPALHRFLGNPVLSGIGRLFFRSPCKDFHCGLRGFSKAAITALDLRTTGMEFASEMIVKATLRKFKIAEVPTSLSKSGRTRRSHIRSWRDGWRHLRFLLLYSPNWLFMIPGYILLLGGTVFGALLIGGPLQIGRLGFDTNTLLMCAMAVLIGFKLIAFATFAKLFAVSEGLLPRDFRLDRILRVFTLEKGIVIGLGFVLVGFALLVAGVRYWQQYDFGAISYPDSLRLVIPGATALTLGVEIIFASFFASILSLSRR